MQPKGPASLHVISCLIVNWFSRPKITHISLNWLIRKMLHVPNSSPITLGKVKFSTFCYCLIRNFVLRPKVFGSCVLSLTWCQILFTTEFQSTHGLHRLCLKFSMVHPYFAWVILDWELNAGKYLYHTLAHLLPSSSGSCWLSMAGVMIFCVNSRFHPPPGVWNMGLIIEISNQCLGHAGPLSEWKG